ncbi:transcription elongation factor elongin A [Anticarsia gemmatalis]|uniref:transcription elongation factor elongin A n=1 Tax=Anticarsia gemmatalis TaxID=129554 RepID=UPI003F76F53B
MASVLDLIKHYQTAIEKYPNTDHQKVLKCIDKLFSLGVTVQHLQETGVGRTVNALRKEPGEVGQAARSLVYKWKMMVASEESDTETEPNETYNGHGSGKESDDNAQKSRNKSDKYKSSRTNERYVNGHHSSNKRKYHSSEEEDSNKRQTQSSSSEDDDKKKSHGRNNHDESESDSDSDNSQSDDSDSDASESSQEEVKVKQEIKREHTSSHKSSSSKYNEHVDTKSSSSSKRSHESDRHSKHQSPQPKVRRISTEKPTSHSSDKHSSHSSDKHSSHASDKHKSHSSERHSSQSFEKHKTSKEKESSTEKKHKPELKSESEKSHKESKSSKHSSSSSVDKHKSSSAHKVDSSSERHKSSSDKHSKGDKHKSSSHSQSSEKEKHKSSSEKESSKHKSKEATNGTSSVEKHRSSSKDKSKERSSSSKEKSSSEKKHSSSAEHKSSSSSRPSEKHSDRSEKKSEHKSSSSSSHKSSKSSSSSKREDVPKKKVQINGGGDSDDGIDCGSGASFAEALGMISPAKPKKKSGSSAKEMSSPNSDMSPAALLAPSAKLAPLPALEISGLPDISPHYKPRPPPRPLPHFSDEDAMSAVISSKNQRTKVYSGNKVIGKIPSLYEMCVHVLQEHIDALEFTGGVPYEILKPVVDRATPQQLYMLEHYNNYLMDDTDHLWQNFCQKHFRNKQRQEMETWREMYARCQEEQEHRLKSLTANIRIAQEAKKAPIKQTKMAYVDSVAKPPRNIAKKQAAMGTARLATGSPAARVASLAAAPNVLRGGASARPVAAPASSGAFHKPKKAPLMAKALQIMRGRKR